MKFLRDNAAYLLLAFVALLLLLVTLNLQMVIWVRQSQGEAQNTRGILYTVRQQLADLIAPASDPPLSRVEPTATALTVPSPTPVVIVVAPTVVATLPPAVPPSPTLVTMAAADVRLGYVAQNQECVAATELVTLILERDFNLRVAPVAFPDAATLYATLAAKSETERVDLTLCYADPTDRAYLQEYFGLMVFVGSGYRQVENQKFIVTSNAAVKSPIERGNPCLYRFLTHLDLNGVDWRTGDAASWYQTQLDRFTPLTQCR
ncbi:MAG: hypothetical protein KF832_11580 [Caldilineaceae bacterium]|nr:hypothetical protein [Caldilineaceae bacterium]